MQPLVLGAADYADYLVSEDNHFNVLHSLPFPQLNLVTIDEFMQTRLISDKQ